jgi:NAD(P)-dependent dehydrogenase (short-subunit alcohol dehydrogenase family)
LVRRGVLLDVTDPDIPLDDVAWENRTYSTFKAYSQSKLANILFAKELAVRLQGNNINKR